MAIRHVADALAMVLAPNLKIVAVTYGNSANNQDDVVFLGMPRVARESGYSERRAQELTRDLERLGILTEVPADDLPPGAFARLKAIPPRYWPTCYRFNGRPDGIPRLDTEGAQSSHPSPNEGVRPRGSRGATTRQIGVRATAPKPEEEPEVNHWARAVRYEPPTEATPTAQPHVWLVAAFNGDPGPVRLDLLWETLVEVCGLDTSQLTEDARGSLNRSIKQLRDVGADPLEIRRRATRYRSGAGPVPAGAKLTHRALVNHWPELGTPDVPAAEATEASRLAGCPPHLRDDAPDPDRGEYCARCKTWSAERAPELVPTTQGADR